METAISPPLPQPFSTSPPTTPANTNITTSTSTATSTTTTNTTPAAISSLSQPLLVSTSFCPSSSLRLLQQQQRQQQRSSPAPCSDSLTIIEPNNTFSLTHQSTTPNRVLPSRLSFVADSDNEVNYLSKPLRCSQRNSSDISIDAYSTLTRTIDQATCNNILTNMGNGDSHAIAAHGTPLAISLSNESGRAEILEGPAGSGAISIRAVGRQSRDTDDNAIHSLATQPSITQPVGHNSSGNTVVAKRSSALVAAQAVPFISDYNKNYDNDDDDNGSTHGLDANKLDHDAVINQTENKTASGRSNISRKSSQNCRHSRIATDVHQSLRKASKSSGTMDISQSDDNGTGGDVGGPSSTLEVVGISIQNNSDVELNNSIREAYASLPVPELQNAVELHKKLDRFGFVQNDERNDDPAFSCPPQTLFEQQRESHRAVKWAKMSTKRWSSTTRSLYSFKIASKFTRRVYKSIPDCWRAEAWHFMLSANNVLPKPEEEIVASYSILLEEVSSYERQIDLDVERTMRSHIMFYQRYGIGQRHLFNVLRAYSNANPEVGYCQGMSTIAAIILLYFDEETTFVVMRILFEKHRLNQLFQPRFPELLKAFYIQTHMLEACAPDLAKHMVDIDVAPGMYAIRWYCTLFSNGTLPFRTALRVWDLLMLKGFDALICVATGLLIHFKDRLLVGNFETVAQFLANTLPFNDEKDDDAFFLGIVRRLLERRKYVEMRQRFSSEYQES
ncbi:rab-GTPase-TBC domain-containing protein [Syncephalis fuscata]|nr:rab-GTPase-TBC domain-containing protein [Syncephalis fuscata]